MKNYEEMASEVLQQRDAFEENRSQRRKTLHRRLTATLTALAIILTIGAIGVGAAVLSGSDWFAGFYSEKSGGGLSDNQLQYLTDKTIDVQQSVTSDGITMTLGAVVNSGNQLHMYVDVVAPKDMSLADINLGDFDSFSLCNENGQLVPLSSVAYDYIPDDDELLNTKTYLFMVSANEEYVFSENGPLIVTFDGLWDGEHENSQQISDGKWNFEIVFTEKDEQSIEVLSEPIVCDGFDWMTKRYSGVVKIHSFTLYDMVGIGDYEFLERVKVEQKDSPDVNIIVVMKDGSTAVNTGSGWKNVHHDGIEKFELRFSEPIILSEVDYVVFGGYEDENGNWVEGTRVDIP